MEGDNLIKKINKEIQKLEQQKQIKLNKKSQLEDELNVIQSQLKDLNNLKNQYEKLEQNTDSFFMKRSKGEENE
ncbi:hypothetical protein GPK27_06600 [Catenibacterium mitsuokai]|jgi:DNA repair exonuclease SbcCD ATPase subunit|uniref:hypothetical protein n=1 Tax=Coprobacillaceae TaxID=2810280 RepID=UPI00192AB7A3|nr:MULTISPECIES: hypothetical protein [Coprobacillaceae]MBT9815115.1 hypothetical protein [Catenibacterium mitsuokai]MCR1948710.1 hypothetical protein [Thomasclavelia ramosa]QQY26167.1 hypothetical protein I6I63_08660 [Thomasclavelia ramosa]